METGYTPLKKNIKRKHESVIVTPPKSSDNRTTYGVTTYYHKKSRTLSTAPINIKEGADILKLTKTFHKEEYKMMFYLNTNYPGDMKPPMVLGYIDGGIIVDLKELNLTKILSAYYENMEGIIFYNDALLNKAHDAHSRKCVNYMKKAIKDIVSNHNSSYTCKGQAQIYGCFIYIGNRRWTGMMNKEDDNIEVLNKVYNTEIDDGYPAMDKQEAENVYLEVIATERDQ